MFVFSLVAVAFSSVFIPGGFPVVHAVPFLMMATALGQSSCTSSYTVQPGDICDSISAANNVST